MNEFLLRVFRWLNPWLAWFEEKPVEVPPRALKNCEDEQNDYRLP